MRNLVVDQEQFNRFVTEVMPPLKPGEVYFVSLSARNKYLTAEEREAFGLGRTEMFGRTLCHGDWDYTMRKLAATLAYKTTKNGQPIPQKASVVYVNINPSNSVLACMNFAKVVMQINSELLSGYMSEKETTPNLKGLDKGDRLLMNEYQKATGTRYYLDVDVDGPVEYADDMKRFLNNHSVVHHLVQTRGGYHFLVNRKSLNESRCQLHKMVADLNEDAKKHGGEVIFNSNAMVPMVGCLQGNHLVNLLY